MYSGKMAIWKVLYFDLPCCLFAPWSFLILSWPAMPALILEESKYHPLVHHTFSLLLNAIPSGGQAWAMVQAVSLSRQVAGSKQPLRICGGRLVSAFPFTRPYSYGSIQHRVYPLMSFVPFCGWQYTWIGMVPYQLLVVVGYDSCLSLLRLHLLPATSYNSG